MYMYYIIVCLFVLFSVAKERQRRRAMEKRLKHMQKLAEQLMRHYDSCFVELAKDVSLPQSKMIA